MKIDKFAKYPSLINKPVMITGGGSGIGASLVEHFVEQDSRVAFIDILEEQSAALVDDLDKRFSNPPLYVKCDLTDITELNNAVDRISSELGPVAVLVNNAGNDERHEFQEPSGDEGVHREPAYAFRISGASEMNAADPVVFSSAPLRSLR